MRANKPVLLGLLLIPALLSIETRLTDAARIDADDNVKTTTINTPSTTSRAAQKKQGMSTKATVHLNFKDADILQIINLMSELTGRNFLIDEKVRGKVTIIAPQPVSLDEAYQVFLSILEIQGFTIVQQGPINKIVPSREVKERPLPISIDSQFPLLSTSDEFITQLIPLEYAEANEIRGLLTPLVSKQSSMLAYAPTNTLILTDVASNISRLLKIIRALDIEAPAASLKVIPLQHAAADQMVTSLQSALEALAQVGSAGGEATASTPATGRSRRQTRRQTSAPRRAPTAPKIIADSRTNSLVVIATRGDMATAESLIAKLDVPTPEGRGQIHVYYLAHASAEELAQVLTAQAAEVARTTVTQEGQANGGRRQANGQTQARRRATPSTATTPSGITITADTPTNSLVISAPPEAYTVLKEIIQKLDIRRSQVLVETLIAEVALSKVEELGVEWRLLDEPNGTQVFASSTGSDSTGVLNALTANPLNPVGGFLIGALRNTITVNGQEIMNIPAVLRAFQGDTDVNILATPNLLTTDNEEAEIIIGEERPFLRSSQDTPSGGVVSTVNTFEFRDTGIILRITPQISQGRTVRLNLFQDINRFLSEAETGAVTTTKRSVKTTVVVDDSQTIVIGGLIQEERDESKTQVPCLGNIPFFGTAFRQTSDRKRKTNLLIFITPHIINSPEDIRLLTEHKRIQSDKTEEIERQLRENQPQENLEILLK
jgi:general secretion pathway protein D